MGRLGAGLENKDESSFDPLMAGGDEVSVSLAFSSRLLAALFGVLLDADFGVVVFGVLLPPIGTFLAGVLGVACCPFSTSAFCVLLLLRGVFPGDDIL